MFKRPITAPIAKMIPIATASPPCKMAELENTPITASATVPAVPPTTAPVETLRGGSAGRLGEVGESEGSGGESPG